MNVKIIPKTLVGKVAAVASKSHAHRLLIAAALSDRPDAAVEMNTTSADIRATQQCLAQLQNRQPVLDCGESGSTLRFLLPVAMALKTKATFCGSGRLPRRPISPLKEEMEAHGCRFSKSLNDDGCADAGSESAGSGPEGSSSSRKNPAGGNSAKETAGAADSSAAAGNAAQPGGSPEEICTVEGALSGGVFTLPGNVSSQYITGLLFALPLLKEDSQIRITSRLESAGYVNLTLQVLREFQIRVEVTEENGCFIFRIPGGQQYIAPEKLKAEGDWSNSAFWIIGGILPPYSAVTCTGLNLGSVQGDKAIAELAKKMGGLILAREEEIMAMSGTLTALEIDASPIPDLVPVLAAAASVSAGTTVIKNAERLRIKESDRLAATCDCLTRLGGKIRETEDGLIITGVPKLKGGTVPGYNDHRIVMAMAIASVCCEEPVIIEGAEAVNKSYPGFFDDFRSLGGEVHVI